MKKPFSFLFKCSLLMLIISCQKDKRGEFVDFLKVSDDAYVEISQISDNLEVPWDIQYNPFTKSIFFTEIKGDISELNLATNTRKVIYTVPDVFQKRTMGLLGLAIHPHFDEKPYLYVCYTLKDGERYFSELSKLTYENGKITDSKALLRVDGALGHNGSRLTFDQSGMLYWATGDIVSDTHAQDSTTLNGKALRMTDEGNIPADNPIPNSYVYAWGFRNIQGMTATPKGQLFTAEHGDAIEDEINLVKPMHNYGWKEIEGYHDTEAERKIASLSPRTEPIKAWTPVIAPAALKFYGYNTISAWNNSLLLTTLKSQSLRILKLNAKQTEIIDEKVYLKDRYGRIRSLTIDEKGNIYIATSNKDWNPQKGFPLHGDDRILKISPIDYKPTKFLEEYKQVDEGPKNGKVLYQSYCASCHKADGTGLKRTFPPLSLTETVRNEDKLIQVMLQGLNGKITVKGEEYDQIMPSFSFLNDIQIKMIADYVRSNFGNNYPQIDEKLVKEWRIKNKGNK